MAHLLHSRLLNLRHALSLVPGAMKGVHGVHERRPFQPREMTPIEEDQT